MTAQTLLQALNRRYATKHFDVSRPIPPEVWSTLEAALVLSPSSFGLQLWKFLVITDADLKAKLRPVAWNQAQITECSHLVAFLAQQDVKQGDIDRYLARIAEVRKVPLESLAGFRAILEGSLLQPTGLGARIPAWTANQTYLALGNLLTSAALLGVDACPMEGFDAVKVDEVLGLQGTRWHVNVLCALGYRSSEDAYATLPKVRYEASEVVEHR